MNPKCPKCKMTVYSEGGQAFPKEKLLFYCPYKCGWWRGWTVNNHRDIEINIKRDGKKGSVILSEVPEVTNYVSLCSLTACHYINIYLMPASLNFALEDQMNGWIVEFCGREIHQINLADDLSSIRALADLWQQELSRFMSGWKGFQEPEYLPDANSTRYLFETRRT